MSKKERAFRGGLRSVARFYAVQMVYRASITESELKKIIDEDCSKIFITENVSISEMDVEFFRQLIEITEENLSVLDKIIAENLSNKWRMDRLDNVIKSILRLGTAELLFFKNIPANVVFNEYIEISKSFFEKNEVAFINGLLNSIANTDSDKKVSSEL
ncbi:MAG: transcription antitermination factor NusB [Holosporaceae bacterium]|nr:transcription antitermination factor NusB [Holosporaceae bacterium]